MATIVQRRRGTTAQHATFTGALGEITVDTDKDVAVIHDGVTAGGFPLAGTMFANIFSAEQTVNLGADLPALTAQLSGVDKWIFYSGGFGTGERLSLTGTVNFGTLSVVSSVTGASSASAVAVDATWNTTAAPTAIDLNVTNTVSAVTSKLLNLRVATVSQFAVFATGNATLLGDFTANKLLLPNTTSAAVGGIYFGGDRAFHNFGVGNTFAGVDAGNFTLTGDYNAFFGNFSGTGSSSGSDNAFFGAHAGRYNTSGASNAFFGAHAGEATLGGGNNSFFGRSAGYSNTSGANNAFFGRTAGFFNISGSNNSFFGVSAGYLSTGGNNILFGFSAGDNITTGGSNIVIGFNIDAPVGTASNQLSIGNLIFGTGIDGTGTTISSGNIGVAVVTPTSGLHLGRSFAAPYRAIAGTDTFAATDYTINATSGTFTLNLPTAVGITGRLYVAKNSGAGIVTLDADGGELIDGVTTQTINPLASLTVQSTGAGWIII